MSQLDDVLKLLDGKIGDLKRLEYIKETLEGNKTLYLSDAAYLQKLVEQQQQTQQQQQHLTDNAPAKPDDSSSLQENAGKTENTAYDNYHRIGQKNKLLYVIPLFLSILGGTAIYLASSSISVFNLGIDILVMSTIGLVLLSLFLIQQKSLFDMTKRLRHVNAAASPAETLAISELSDQIQALRHEQNKLQENFPHTSEISSMQNENRELHAKFQRQEEQLTDTINKFMHNTAKDMEDTKNEMIRDATNKVTDYATKHLDENAVSKKDFERLKERIEKMLGADEVADRMEVLSSLFDSRDMRVINWQCRLVRLLKGGLAPDAEEDMLASEGIPISRYKQFLHKLTEKGITKSKNIVSYYLEPEFEWIYSYVDNPDWLENRLGEKIKKEKEYQSYIKNNLDLLESGLLLESSEYALQTGKIDFLCRDAQGRAVGLELKYPVASVSVKRQIAGYRIDYEYKTGIPNSRFIVVAPQIPEKLQELLTKDGFEFKEIPFSDVQ